MVKYKAFKIGGKSGLFDIATGRDVIISTTEVGNIPLISHQHENNGITKYVKRIPNRRLFNYKKTIALADRGVFYATTQCEDFHIGTRVKALIFKQGEMSEKTRLFFVSAINKLQVLFKDYLTNATDKLPNLEIMLPINSDEEIDYKYMENYISELTAYLKVSGLENYHLTISEKNILEQFKAKNINFSKYKIDDLFDIHPTKSYGLTNNKLFTTKGQTPVVVNSSVNNGIGGYVNLPATEKGNMITFSDTTTDNAIFYQPNDFIGYSHVQGLYPKHNLVWSEKALLYFLTLFKKCAKGRFDYATKFNRTIAAQMEVELPIKNGKIDFEFMENFINIQHKLAIKSVVDWRDKEIDISKKVINN